MRHPRSALLLLLVVPLLALAACGDDSPAGDAGATLPPVTTAAPTRPTEPAGAYDLATAPDEVVVSVTVEGGFVPVGVAFANTPVALVTGDRVLSTGPVIASFPGPLLPNIQQRSITPTGLQVLVAKADQLGLLADVTYEGNDMIADAGTTVVELTVGGTTYRHAAYALGLDTETDPARRALSDFVAAISDLPATVGAGELGPEEPHQADAFLIQALPIDRAGIGGDDIEPTFVPWPPDASVRLADAATCAVLPAAEGVALFADATTLTFFTEPEPTTGGEVTYQVTPVPQLPGRTC